MEVFYRNPCDLVFVILVLSNKALAPHCILNLHLGAIIPQTLQEVAGSTVLTETAQSHLWTSLDHRTRPAWHTTHTEHALCSHQISSVSYKNLVHKESSNNKLKLFYIVLNCLQANIFAQGKKEVKLCEKAPYPVSFDYAVTFNVYAHVRPPPLANSINSVSLFLSFYQASSEKTETLQHGKIKQPSC